MKTRLTFLTAIVPALLLALFIQSSALAQANDESKPPPATGRGRQAISNKLDRIRLDTVLYDGLPLSEIVRNLRDEAKKRDPDKKGVNFIINPNAPAVAVPAAIDPATGLPVAAPATSEAIDVNSIGVRINPPLNDVRLVDVLDAVVKVADHPIKYVVEDYGVVFSLKASEPARKEETGFAFAGGTPSQFLDAVQKQYKVDWSSVADIPEEMRDVRIPSLRINPESFEQILGRGPQGRLGLANNPYQQAPLDALVTLYNELGKRKPELGQLVIAGGIEHPSVVMFVPDKAAAKTLPELKVRAFPLMGIAPKYWDRLEEDVAKAAADLAALSTAGLSREQVARQKGYLTIHRDTSLLVAYGPDPFQVMVETFVSAYRANGEAQGRGADLLNRPVETKPAGEKK
jgi:hypothetical protein